MAEKNPLHEEIMDNPLNGNGNASAVDEEVAEGEQPSYRKEEFIRTRNQIVDRLGRMKEDLSSVDTEDLGRRAGQWVRENPILSVTIAAGAGILIGRGLVSLLTPSPPPPLPVRARRRARTLARDAEDYLGDVGAALTARAADAGAFLKSKADEAGADLAKKAQELSDELADKAGDVAGTIAGSAQRAGRTAADTAQEIPGILKTRASQGRDFTDSLMGSIKAAAAALVVRRLGEWMRRAS